MANGVNREHGPYRRPMGGSRTIVPSEAKAHGQGRPRQDTRAVLNGVFLILRTGAPGHDLPSRYPSYQTCQLRFQHWQRSGLLTRLLQKLAETYETEGSSI